MPVAMKQKKACPVQSLQCHHEVSKEMHASHVTCLLKKKSTKESKSRVEKCWQKAGGKSVFSCQNAVKWGMAGGVGHHRFIHGNRTENKKNVEKE